MTDRDHRQKVSPLRRWFCAPVIMLSTLAGVGPFVDAGSFTSPLFEPIRNIAPLRFWGVAWLATAGAAAHAALRGSWFSYMMANSLVAGLSALWLGALVYGRWWLDLPLSTTAIGLWMFPLAYAVVASVVPTEIAEVPRDLRSRRRL